MSGNTEQKSESLKPDHGLSGAAYDTLFCLFAHGATFDGDVPSKCGRDHLVQRGLAARAGGYQTLTLDGLRVGLELGMARKKEQYERKRYAKAAQNQRTVRSLLSQLRPANFKEPE